MMIGEDYSLVMNYLRKFEVDINPARIGIGEDVFVTCMQKAVTVRNDRYTYLHVVEEL